MEFNQSRTVEPWLTDIRISIPKNSEIGTGSVKFVYVILGAGDKVGQVRSFTRELASVPMSSYEAVLQYFIEEFKKENQDRGVIQ